MSNYIDEQLKYRKKKDDEKYIQAIENIADVVLGKSITKFYDERVVAQSAIGEIIKYFHFRIDNIEVPSYVNTVEEHIEYMTKLFGIMNREVRLDENWYKYATEPMIGRLKETRTVVALLPDFAGGYKYVDFANAKKGKINKKNASELEIEATCFYRPLPLKALNIFDLARFMFESFNMRDIVLFFASSILVALISLLTPIFTRILVGDVIELQNIQVFVSIAIFMICSAIATLFFGIFKETMKCKLVTKQNAAVQTALLGRIFALPISFFKKFTSGELANRILSVQTVSSSLLYVIWTAIIMLLFSFLYFLEINYYASELLPISLVVVALNIALIILTVIFSKNINTDRLELSSKNSGSTVSLISGIQKIKVSGAEKRMFAKWVSEYKNVANLEYNIPLFLKLTNPLNLIINVFGTIYIYEIAIKYSISVENYYAYYTAFALILVVINQIIINMPNIILIWPTINTLKPIFDAVPEISEEKRYVKELKGNIELNNISFRYSKDMPYILDNISLKIRSGEYIGIVGSTGCGKSTLIRLLLGFEELSNGVIYYDRYDMKKISLVSLRKNIGTVLQNDTLFTGDIFTNISMNNPYMSEDDAWEVAKLSSIYDEIKAMPMGMKTNITEGSGSISGGQKQRILIARALASKPKILIFDEATSALDNVTQKKVSESLDSLNCTRIVVAHRLSTIIHCDRIIVLDGGHIVEEGKYEELIQNDGLFKKLVERQMVNVDKNCNL